MSLYGEYMVNTPIERQFQNSSISLGSTHNSPEATPFILRSGMYSYQQITLQLAANQYHIVLQVAVDENRLD